MTKPLFIAILSAFFAAPPLAAQGVVKIFDFGSGRSDYRRVSVTASDVYDRNKGFGFEPGAEIVCSPKGDRSASCFSGKPFYFSAAVPEGNYRVTVTFGDNNAPSSTTVKAELRRLMLEKVETEKGRFIKRQFTVNIRTPNIPGGGEVRLKNRERTSEQWAWDERLTLEFNGTRPSVRSIVLESVDVPTIFLLGDSTVCDQPSEPYASWGQMITRFFSDKIAVANHAESGESLKSSLAVKRLDKVLSLMRPGDYLLIQYGHNDEKEKGEGIGAFTTYKAGLKHFTAEARSKGGIPILITPMHRRTFGEDGHVTNSHGDYPDAVRRVAREENVALIDLNTMSKNFYEALGPKRSAAAFAEGDGTHHNNYGSYELAKCIVQAIRDQKLPLGKYLIRGLPKFEPKQPDTPETFALPASLTSSGTRPFGS